jgi:polyphosphate kinase
MEQDQYIKRDISWLYFNHRVLQEAMDERVPLYERIKFLAIYSSNLDEYFRVRVASLRSFKDLKKKTRRALEIVEKPKKQLKQIRKIVQKQQEQFGHTFRNEILPALERHNIFLMQSHDYSTDQAEFVKKYFFEKVYPNLNPAYLEVGKEPPFLKNKGLYFVVTFADPEAPLAIVEIPSDQLPRFQVLPGDGQAHHITFLDDIIRYNLDALLGKKAAEAYAIKISRDAELYIEDEYSGDLVEKIRISLAERNVGLPTRFLYDQRMPEEVLNQAKQAFGLSKNDLIPGARYHNFNDFFGFPMPEGMPELQNEPLPPLPHPQLEGVPSILSYISNQDVMLHFPYQRYAYVTQLIREAVADPAVEHLKITLYRVASKSAIVEALLEALKKGKSVTAFIEAKARFDEASNLYWGDQLKEAGATVIYSYPGIKVHTKLLLIQRREEDAIKNYAYLGTGNFNEKTAKLYCDHALLTADPRLADEVNIVFSLLEKKIIVPKCKHLLVSPFTTRDGFTAMVDREIALAKEGKDAYLILKMNSLEDPGMINKLYEASQAGVRIQLIVRGIFCLIPGIEGLSENISAISIVDRFLEHARVYIFGNDGEERMFTASADWMTRNLDRRVEVVIPIYDEKVKAELRHIIELQLNDNQKARHLNAAQNNEHKTFGEVAIRAQRDTYSFLKHRVEKNMEAQSGES